MIRRVTRQPAPPLLRAAALPPGTPADTVLSVVYVSAANAQAGMIPADALVTADGRPVYATAPGRWAQLAAIGRRG